MSPPVKTVLNPNSLRCIQLVLALWIYDIALILATFRPQIQWDLTTIYNSHIMNLISCHNHTLYTTPWHSRAPLHPGQHNTMLNTASNKKYDISHLWTHKIYPIYRIHERAMGWVLQILSRKKIIPWYNGFTLYPHPCTHTSAAPFTKMK